MLLGVHAARHNGQALNYSVEFLGGAVVQVQFDKNASPDAVRSAVDKAGFTKFRRATETPFNIILEARP